jgi:uncharacterized membrane protein
MWLAISTYEVSLVVHITAAIVGLGATFVESLTFPVAMRLDARHLPYKHRLQFAINLYLALPALVVLLPTGIYQASEAGYDLDTVWLTGAMGIVLVLGVMIGAYFIPEDRRLQTMVERDIAAAGVGEVTLSAEYRRRVRTEEILGHAAGVLVIAAVYLMVAKPGL